MKKYIILLIAILATGCQSYNAGRVPEAVAVMPNDCANFRAIEKYMIELTETKKSPLMSEEQYEIKQSYYKRALWQLRYNCHSS